MGKKDNFQGYSKIILPSFASSFTPENKQKKLWKTILKHTLRWLKFAIYIFLFGIGLYGCGQSMAEYWVSNSTNIGVGLEVGFAPGTTGNPFFDLIPTPGQAFFPFNEFSMDYGPFYALFVWPFARLFLEFMYATRNWPLGLGGLFGIIIILIIIRLITFFISIRSTFQTEKMQEIQGKVAEINSKYKDSKDMQSRQKKQMEINELYKKYKVKPFAAFEQIFVTLPILLIVFRVINIVRPLKATILFDIWDLGTSPVQAIFSNFIDGGWTYIFFLLIVIPTQFISQKIPQKLSRKRSRNAQTVGVQNNKSLNRTKTISTVMNVFMAIIAAVSASGVGIYWFFSSLISLLQSYVVHRIIMARRKGKTSIESKLSNLGINNE